MARAIISLGSNLGNKEQNIKKALIQIDKRVGTIKRKASFYTSEPVGFKHPNKFLNTAVEIETEKAPEALLTELENIEKELGRTHKTKDQQYQARQIDLDIIFYDNIIINTKRLKIPHQHAHKRKFVLMPLAEINKNFIHPILNKTIEQLLITCEDKSLIFKNKPH